MARELHDGVAQTLYAIGLAAARALELVDGREANQLEQLLDKVLELAGDGQREVRALITKSWSDEPPPGSLIEALVALAAAHEASQGGQVRLALASEPDLSPRATAMLVQIAREALHNIAKHARARHVDLVLEAGSDQVELLIADDGLGFDTTAPRRGHFGVRSMRERAQALGGTFEVASVAGAGTRIRVRVPRLGS